MDGFDFMRKELRYGSGMKGLVHRSTTLTPENDYMPSRCAGELTQVLTLLLVHNPCEVRWYVQHNINGKSLGQVQG
jgi:hypothetical protein